MLQKESRKIDKDRGGIRNYPKGNTKVDSHSVLHEKIEENC